MAVVAVARNEKCQTRQDLWPTAAVVVDVCLVADPSVDRSVVQPQQQQQDRQKAKESICPDICLSESR
jgi:hypothetical protein